MRIHGITFICRNTILLETTVTTDLVEQSLSNSPAI